MMSKPIIGISVNIRPDVGSYGEFRISKSYVDFIIRAGGIPQLIPIMDHDLIPEFIDNYEGILFSGGGGLLPEIKVMDELPDLRTQNPLRYDFELSLIQAAIKQKIPVMGICRGHQMINDALGGYVKNLNNESHRQNKPYDVAVHSVKIDKDSHLYEATGTNKLNVNSLHRQVIDEVGENLKVTAFSDDNYIEAIEGTKDSFIMGIQFHPELMADDKEMLNIYKKLIVAARKKQTNEP